MFERIKNHTVPHLVGFLMIVAGWYVSILRTALDKFDTNMFNTTTTIGLIMIVIGAYIPEVWIAIKNRD